MLLYFQMPIRSRAYILHAGHLHENLVCPFSNGRLTLTDRGLDLPPVVFRVDVTDRAARSRAGLVSVIKLRLLFLIGL